MKGGGCHTDTHRHGKTCLQQRPKHGRFTAGPSCVLLADRFKRHDKVAHQNILSVEIRWGNVRGRRRLALDAVPGQVYSMRNLRRIPVSARMG
jgi:hypothetical protein